VIIEITEKEAARLEQLLRKSIKTNRLALDRNTSPGEMANGLKNSLLEKKQILKKLTTAIAQSKPAEMQDSVGQEQCRM